MREWCRQYDLILPKLDTETVLNGYTSESDCNLIINHILLIYKWVVYVCRDKQEQPNLEYFKSQLGEIEQTENRIARSKGTYSLHLKKWQNLADAI